MAAGPANRLAAPLRADQRLLVPDDNHDHTLRAPAGQTGGQVWVAAFDSWPDEIDWIADHANASAKTLSFAEVMQPRDVA